MNQHKTAPTPENLWSADRVAKRIGVHLATLNRYVAKGEFPAPYRIGPRLRKWDPADVLAWIEGREGK